MAYSLYIYFVRIFYVLYPYERRFRNLKIHIPVFGGRQIASKYREQHVSLENSSEKSRSQFCKVGEYWRQEYLGFIWQSRGVVRGCPEAFFPYISITYDILLVLWRDHGHNLNLSS